MKAFEKEMNNKKSGDAVKFMIVGMKLKPFDTIVTLINKSNNKGYGYH